MKSPALALHEAQIVRIEAYTDYKLFDAHPENEPFPYVTLGEITARDWSDKSDNGMEVFTTLHIWSQYHGRKQADEMADAILQALTSSPLGLGSEFREALGVFDSYNLITDMDGKTRHGILKFKYLIEEL